MLAIVCVSLRAVARARCVVTWCIGDVPCWGTIPKGGGRCGWSWNKRLNRQEILVAMVAILTYRYSDCDQLLSSLCERHQRADWGRSKTQLLANVERSACNHAPTLFSTRFHVRVLYQRIRKLCAGPRSMDHAAQLNSLRLAVCMQHFAFASPAQPAGGCTQRVLYRHTNARARCH